MYKSVWEFKVRFAETDAAGIVYYPNFYKWMDQAFHEMFAAIGFPTRKQQNESLGTPLVEAHCQFRRPLNFDDWVKVVSVVSEVKNKVFKIEHTFYLGENLVAEGYEIRAWVSLNGGKLKAEPIPEELRQRLLSSNL
ncbi:thioesterase family protein [Paenibacillus validus]|uniref:Acyl-CoA thioesterase n=1 Tax=Paenibacillus validus TaxID=44253 RepID=A0A7X2Z6I4_9BACL|nr:MULTISPECIES: thioesterase family protein [Paenibacillus]MED4601195.1 thioesterase family protein [Paenibacillus validus]MED4606922.1 thioesterase family protein [Paenibacillus validus]MUG69268.1 acyl-CoA thioesterase [Paenibacillus validus]